ncbi:MAG: nucleoside 2-deoxyribosyltransferase [Ardenticatenaceae bacterium]|nr:nucleoside 2-deoxyribosyltransferase [Ardenticatenaceae bacterium]
MKIVLTGPSSAPYAREYLSNMATTLRNRGHDVFVPHEGGWQSPPNPWTENRIDFEATYQALHDADLLMAVLDGYTVDDAVAAQIGIFYTLAREEERRRRIVGLLHDTRVAGWEWTGADIGVTPQIRHAIHQFGDVYQNFKKALVALEPEGV